MAITRSKAAAMAAAAARHPQAVDAFREGLGAVFRQWTALELAVYHQWGGPSSKDRAVSLQEEILEMFLGPDKIYKDDISLILEDYLETEFNTICEDGSPDELGELFVTLWRQCCEGDFTLVNNIMAKETMRKDFIAQSQGLADGDIDDGASDGDPENEEMLNEMIDEAVQQELQKSEGDMAGQMEEEENTPPLVDPDGWETVTRGKKKPQKKYKI